LNEVETLVSEFENLPNGTKLRVATQVFGRMKTLEKGSNDLLEHMGDLIIENKDLQEENHTLKNDLKHLDKYAPQKYKKADRALITNSDKKNIAKQYLWNKLGGRVSTSLEQQICDGKTTIDDRKKTKQMLFSNA
jgi:hypothetical protein